MAETPEPMTMDSFLAKHGEDGLNTLETPIGTPRQADSVAPAPVPPQTPPLAEKDSLPDASVDESSEGEETKSKLTSELTLDQATMEALGLQPPAEAGSDAEGTEKIEVELETLAKYFGADQDLFSLKDGQVQVRTKVDGEVSDKSLSDLLKGYQLQKHTTQKSMELADERKQWEEQRQTQEQQLQQQFALANQLLQTESQEIQKRYAEIDWNKLRAEDPAQYAAFQADYGREMATVQQRQQQLYQAAQQTQQEQATKMQEQYTELRKAELQKLYNAMQWTPETAGEKVKPISQYLVGKAGYTPQQLEHIFDHRFVMLADKARQWDELQGRVKEIREKKVVPIRKTPAGATSTEGADASAGRRKQAAMQQLKKSGSVEDAAAVFRQIPGLFE